MNLQHKRFLENIIPRIPRLLGLSWTSNQERPLWWTKFDSVERVRQQVADTRQDPKLALASLVYQAQRILNCEIVGLFVAEPPIPIVSSDAAPPMDIAGKLRLQTDSHVRRGSRKDPSEVVLPLSQPGNSKIGLTVGLLQFPPLGRAIRLHNQWLQEHPHVKSWQDHDHLDDRTCHSLAAVAVIGQHRVLGLLKAENKFRQNPPNEQKEWISFELDDGIILEHLAAAAIPLLERL